MSIYWNSGNVARKLDCLSRKQNDGKAWSWIIRLDSLGWNDPVK
jgi:hypothetical protein